MELSFPTRKLKNSLIKISRRYRDIQKDKPVQAYGVTNKEGIVITGKDVSLDTSNYIFVEGNTFVYNPYRVNVGSIGLSEQGFCGIVSPAYVVFTAKKDINPDFLFLYLKSSLGLNLIKWYGDKGGVRSALSFKDLCEIDFPDLSYEQQTKALGKIKSFINKTNQICERFSQSLESISKLKQSILQDAIQGKLVPQDPNDEPAEKLLEKIKVEKEKLIKEGKLKKEKPLPPTNPKDFPFELPKGWEWCIADKFCTQITDGTHHTPTYLHSGIPFLSVKDLTGGKLEFSNSKFISKEEHAELSKRCHPEFNNVLLTKVGTTGIARVVDTKEEFSIFVSLSLLKFNSDYIDPYYLELCINSPYVRKLSKEGTEGIGNKNLVLRKIKSFLIPIPPLNEQKRIVEKVNSLTKICDEQEKNISEAKENIEKLNQAILKEMFDAN